MGMLRKGEMLNELVRSSDPKLSGGEAEKRKAGLEITEERWTVRSWSGAWDIVEDWRRSGN